MSWVAVAVGGASLVGGVAGGLLSKPKSSSGKMPVQFYDPDNEFLNAILSQEAATGLGYFDRGTYLEASPINQASAEVGRRGTLNRKNYAKFQTALSSLKQAIDRGDRNYLPYGQLWEMVSASGYNTIDELIDAEIAYRKRADELETQINPTADRMREALNASRNRFADYVKDLPNLLTSDESNPFIKQLREETLAQANKYGFNPYKGLETARSDALARALQLIGAETSIVGGQMGQALPVAQLAAGQSASAAQIGSAQAQAIAQAVLADQNAMNQWRQQLGQSVSGAVNTGATLYGAGQLGLFDSGPAAGGGRSTRGLGVTDTQTASGLMPYFSYLGR